MNQNLNSINQQSSDLKQFDIFDNEVPQDFANSQQNEEFAMFKEPVKFDAQIDAKSCFDVSEFFSKIDQVNLPEKVSTYYDTFKENGNNDHSNMSQDYEFSQDFNVSELNSPINDVDVNIESQFQRSNSRKFSELIDDFPEIESFILQDSDSLCLDFGKDFSEVQADNTLGNDSRKERIKRWLKNEDRMMFKIIYDSIKSFNINADILLLNMKKSEDCRFAWNLVKSKLNTSRSLKYLQLRYQKLIKIQTLNEKELSLLSVQYNKLPIEKFMVIFPGKSYDTISKLIHKFEKKNEESEIIASKLDQQIQNLNQNDEFELKIGASNMVISFVTDRQQTIEVGSFNELCSQEYLKTLDQRFLKRLQYNIKEVIGNIYKLRNQIRADIFESINLN